MPSTCTFSFDRPDPVYYSGETISGYISLTTTSEKNTRGAYIIFEGKAKVRWDESHTRTRNGRTESYTVQYSGDESYLNTEIRISDERKFPPGTYDYTFNIPLPLECPTSCTEEYGSISYELSLKLDRRLQFDNVFTQPLTVIKELNLNHSPELLIPVTNETIKYFCCWPCSSGPVISTLTIPFGGWAPGQEIPYQLVVDNQSSGYDSSGTRLLLKQGYDFTAHYPKHKTRSHTNILTNLGQEDRTVLRLSKRVFEGKLRIPPVPPTSMDSGIITVSYYIQMIIQTGDCHSDSDIWIPITIGTIPLAQSATNPDHIFAIQPTAPSPDTPDEPDKPPSYDIYMPPSFEEATHIGKKFKDTDKDEYQNKSIEGWVPKYPMYTNFSVPTEPREPSAPPPYTSEESGDTESQTFLNIGPNANTIPPSESNGSQPSSSQCPDPTTSASGGVTSLPSSSQEQNEKK